MAAYHEACAYIKHLFRNDSTWRAANKDEIRATKVLLRQPQYAVLECLRGDDTPCIVKVTNEVLAHLSTSTSRKIFVWKLCGKDQFGLVLPPEDADVSDTFLLRDEPQVSPGFSDPSYRPLPEHFEPWAQHFASYELHAGYGQCLDDSTLGETWMGGFFQAGCSESAAFIESAIPIQQHLSNTSEALSEPQRTETDRPPQSRLDLTEMSVLAQTQDSTWFEPWAVGHTPYTDRSIPFVDSIDDQFHEPWSAHLVPAETRSKTTCRTDHRFAPSTPAFKGWSLPSRVASWLKDLCGPPITQSCLDEVRAFLHQTSMTPDPSRDKIHGSTSSRYSQFEFPSRDRVTQPNTPTDRSVLLDPELSSPSRGSQHNQYSLIGHTERSDLQIPGWLQPPSCIQPTTRCCSILLYPPRSDTAKSLKPRLC